MVAPINKLFGRTLILGVLIIPNLLVCRSSKIDDLSIVGCVNASDGLGSISFSLISSLKKHLNINLIPLDDSCISTQDMTPSVLKILNKKRKPSNVSVFLGSLWQKDIGSQQVKKIHNKSKIKIALSMIERDRIPPQWVHVLNTEFDALIVPDKWLVKLYSDQGVTIPIYEIPLPMNNLHKMLSLPKKKERNKPFVFGNMGALKESSIIIDAFRKAFKNSPDVKLILHHRYPDRNKIAAFQEKLSRENITNVELSFTSLPIEKYIDKFRTFDCYVNLSRGEGFSYIPREALALGLPVMILDHTAHTTICRTNLIKCIKAHVLEPYYYEQFGLHCQGYNCLVEDAEKAFLDVYNNYGHYAKKASLGRKWVRQYLPQVIYKKYLNMFKPKTIALGSQNKLSATGIVTTSKAFLAKCKKTFNI